MALVVVLTCNETKREKWEVNIDYHGQVEGEP